MAVDVFISGTTTSNGTTAYVKTRIPAIVKTGTTLVAFAEGRRIDADFGDIEIICSRSTDGGATWTGTDVIRVADNGADTAGNPTPVVNSSGNIILLYTQQDDAAGSSRFIYKTVSTDAGLTWSAGTLVSQARDADWTWVATGPCHGLRLSTGPHVGRLVIPINGNKSSVYIAGVIYSDDEGTTWTRSATYESSSGVYNTNESSVSELTDGRLALFSRNQAGSGGEKSVMYSSDSGATWTNPVDAVIESAGAVQGSSLLHAGTPNKALFYATPEILSGSNRLDLRILRSMNNGTTWDLEEYINANAAYSDLIQTGPNSIGILYEQGVSPQYQRISFLDVNLSVIHQVGTATTANTGGVDNTSITVNKPTGVLEGHILLAAITSNSAVATPPAGWTGFNDSGTTIRTQMFWKLATDTEGSNYTFSFTGARPILGTITAWSGVDPVTPIAGTATAVVDTGVAEPVTTPTLSNNTAQRGLVMYMRSSYNSNSVSPVTNSTAVTTVTEIADNSVATASTNRGHTWYVDNSEFTNNTASKTGIAITAGDTEEGNIHYTFVLQTAGDIAEWEIGGVTETESISSTLSDSESGVGTEEGFLDGGADAVYYLDDGGINFSNGRIQFTVESIEEDPTNLSGAAIRFRRLDESNWWEFGMSPTTNEYILRKKIAGDLFTMVEPGLTRASGDILKVETYEERINCYVNNTLIISITDTDLMNEATVGIRFSQGCIDTVVDNFYALVLEEDIRLDLGFYPEYQIFVDWDDDKGLTFGDFETTLDGWTTFGTRPPDIDVSDIIVRSGFNSMYLNWDNWNMFRFDTAGAGFDQGEFGGPEYENPPIPFKFDQAGQGFDDGYFAVTKNDSQPSQSEPAYISPGVQKTATGLVPGRVYEVRTWVYSPTFSTPISLAVKGISGAVVSTQDNEWEELIYTFTATATQHIVQFTSAEPNPGDNDEAYIDEVMIVGAYEEITCYLLNEQSSLEFRYGRDQARSLASIAPGEVSMDLNNVTQIFSPDNPGSVLVQFLQPGKRVLIRAKYNNQHYNIFHGFVDDYTLHPDVGDQYVTMTAMDALQYLGNASISTDLYPSIQTGEAVSVILDAIKWPEEKRFIDQGATTVRWWAVNDTDGLQAVQELIESEGIPSIAYVDTFGNFIFRSRHHRLLRKESVGVQSFLRSDSEFNEPNFSGPITYDIGWKDIINQIHVDVNDRTPIAFDEVWSQSDIVVIQPGETKTISLSTSSPFYGAVTPSVANEGVILQTGSGTPTTINMKKTSGLVNTLEITAGLTTVRIKNLSIKAFSVPDNDNKVGYIREDSSSVAKYGPQAIDEDAFRWAGINDTDAIAQIVLGHRSDRLPVVQLKLNNGHPIRISNILNRKLSDRIHIQEMLQTFMDDDYFIEVLEHSITNNGMSHVLTLGCEQAQIDSVVDEDQPAANPVFTFDVSGQGFDDGYFTGGSSGSGFTSSDKLFILDQSKLNEDGLGF